MDTKTAIRLTGVRKTYRLYGSFQTMALDRMSVPHWIMGKAAHQIRDFHALDGVDLDIRRGERLGILGRNGAGKTTLLKIITGNFAASAGTVEVNGSIQALMQTGYGFHADRTGEENIRASLIFNGLSEDRLDRAAHEVAEFVELGIHLQQPVTTYSSGMIARLQFACATAIEPDILIVDEIMGAGDAYFTAKCSERMRKLTQSGCTLLLVSHSTQQVLQYCDRAIWLRGGRVYASGPAVEVVAQYEVYIQRLLQIGFDNTTNVSEGDKFSSNTKSCLADGRSVYRWPGKAGLRIINYTVNEKRSDSTRIASGDTLDIMFDMVSDIDASFCCRYYFNFWTIDGHRAGRSDSPPDRFRMQAGEPRTVKTQIPLALGGGDYLMTISVYDYSTGSTLANDSRYDMLMRCHKITVDDTRDVRAASYPPSEWTFY